MKKRMAAVLAGAAIMAGAGMASATTIINNGDGTWTQEEVVSSATHTGTTASYTALYDLVVQKFFQPLAQLIGINISINSDLDSGSGPNISQFSIKNYNTSSIQNYKASMTDTFTYSGLPGLASVVTAPSFDMPTDTSSTVYQAISKNTTTTFNNAGVGLHDDHSNDLVLDPTLFALYTGALGDTFDIHVSMNGSTTVMDKTGNTPVNSVRLLQDATHLLRDNTDSSVTVDYVYTPVPEPGTMALLGVGFFGLAIFGKRRKNV